MTSKLLPLVCVLLLIAGCSRSIWALPTRKNRNFPAQRVELVQNDGSRRLMWCVPYWQNEKLLWSVLGPVKEEPTTQPEEKP